MKTIRGMCPCCEDFTNITIHTEQETISYRGHLVSHIAVYSTCNTCGGEFATGEQMETTLINAREAYNQLTNTHVLFKKERYGDYV